MWASVSKLGFGHTACARSELLAVRHTRMSSSCIIHSCPTISFAQDLEDFGNRLPRDVASLPILIVRQEGQTGCNHQDFRVRTWFVLKLLEALKEIHPEVYGNINIHDQNVAELERLGCGSRRESKGEGKNVFPHLSQTTAQVAPESARGPAGASGFDDYEMADMGSSGINGRIDTVSRAAHKPIRSTPCQLQAPLAEQITLLCVTGRCEDDRRACCGCHGQVWRMRDVGYGGRDAGERQADCVAIEQEQPAPNALAEHTQGTCA